MPALKAFCGYCAALLRDSDKTFRRIRQIVRFAYLIQKRQIVFCLRRNVFSAVGNLRFPVMASKTLYHINKPLGLQPLTGKRLSFSGSGTMFSQASEIFDFRLGREVIIPHLR